VDVDTPHQPEVLFRYLADPANRPEWQSSLRSVLLEGPADEPRVGMRWRETTVVGVRPQMRITELEPYRVWAEFGTWGGIEGRLTLRFTAIPAGCRVTAEVALTGRGPWAVPAYAAARLAPRALRADLERASGILSQRT
jgi:uncharacterized protein YndB with AHSA1/START domain